MILYICSAGCSSWLAYHFDLVMVVCSSHTPATIKYELKMKRS